MDWIQLTGVNATGYHGVFEHERREGQTFVVDVNIRCDFTTAASTDEVTDTIHYGEIANLVHRHITGEPVNLIEKLAARISQDILEQHPGVAELEVTIHKPQAPIEVPFGSVAVTHKSSRADNHASNNDAVNSNASNRHQAVLALGANLDSSAGDKHQTLVAAVKQINAHRDITVIRQSEQIITDPVGGPADQPQYANMVIEVATTLKPFELLGACQQIEADFGRVREIHWGPRSLDIDMITYENLTQDSPILTLPHPRAHERSFVLAPWHQMDPDATLGGASVQELLEGLDD